MIPTLKKLSATNVMALLFVFGANAQPARQVLRNHMPEMVSHLKPIGEVAASRQLHLAIGLPLRNRDELQKFLRDVSDPASADYRHYLTPEQFAERFGPTEQDYQTVANFFRANGFTVGVEPINRVVLDVDGPARNIERVFHTTLRTYRHPRENRIFFAPDVEPSIDLPVAVSHVSGLNDYTSLRPKLIKKRLETASKNVSPRLGSFGGLYAGNDFRAAYAPGVSLTGAGQTLALLEFDSYYSNDIVTYENDVGLNQMAITNISVDGGVSSPGDGNVEVALDIEVAMAMAPGLSKIVVYEAPNTDNQSVFDDILAAIADDTNHFAAQISCSWGNTSPSSPDTTAENIFLQMKAQGQSFFDASGDSDAFVSGIPFPSESTNITQVGGTSLATTGAGGAYVWESAWNWGGGTGSSGGVSGNFSIPSWQQGISMTNNLGSTTKRNVPDVAMTADNVFVVADNGSQYTVGGTSAAAPLWAAFTALVNQQAANDGKPPVGFINPAIYSIGKSANYSSDFNDIVTGNNFFSGSTNKFLAVPGYDLCTGWGTPAGDNLIDALSGVSDSLAVAPGKGFVAFGPTSGAFTQTTENFSLTNSGNAPLNWSLLNNSSWLTASATNGALMPGTATNVTVSLNNAAYNLAAGTYTANLWFTNQTTQAARERQFVLFVGQQLLQNGGFELGYFSFWPQSGVGNGKINGYNYDVVTNSVSGISPHSGSYFAAFGANGLTGYISQTIPTMPGQAYLISFWLINPNGGSTEQLMVNWNTNSASANTIFSLTNPGAFQWTNHIFVATATGTNTVLQFGARNDPSYFGLDDVSVTPIPNPFLRFFSKTNGSLTFGWNTLSGVQYQVQYSTNLAAGNWINLGGVINASNSTLSATNSIGTDPQRFYRIRLLP